jgi:hypothetical protein
VPRRHGHALAYVYFEDEPGRRAAPHLMTRDEARRSRPTSPSAEAAGTLSKSGFPFASKKILWMGEGFAVAFSFSV